jgi:hypothetical protein
MARYAGGGKATVESCRSIDVLDWYRRGYLQSPQWFSWAWTRDGERVASISVQTERRCVTLKYRNRSYGDDWSDVEQRVPVAWTPCRFGGEKPQFVCSVASNGAYCGRRVIKLYGAGRLFACRHCYRLAYASQSEAQWYRALRRANKVRQRLGGDPGMDSPFPPRPKGMWRRTYEHLRERCFDVEMRADRAFELHAGRLLARIENPKRGRHDRRRSYWP